MDAASLRWGRILLGGFLGEVILIAAVIPLYALGSAESAITVLAVVGSYVAFVPVAWWLSRTLPRPVLHGMLMGAVAATIYIVLSVVGQQFVPDAPPVPLVYYFAHVLKLAGGATGGWLAGRVAAPARPARAGQT
jgi:hypothetical protein